MYRCTAVLPYTCVSGPAAPSMFRSPNLCSSAAAASTPSISSISASSSSVSASISSASISSSTHSCSRSLRPSRSLRSLSLRSSRRFSGVAAGSGNACRNGHGVRNATKPTCVSRSATRPTCPRMRSQLAGSSTSGYGGSKNARSRGRGQRANVAGPIASARSTSHRSPHPSSSMFCSSNVAAALSRSTNSTNEAPRLSASRPIEPEPANASRTRAPSKCPRRIEKTDSFTRSGIGRVVLASLGEMSCRRLNSPEMIRMRIRAKTDHTAGSSAAAPRPHHSATVPRMADEYALLTGPHALSEPS